MLSRDLLMPSVMAALLLASPCAGKPGSESLVGAGAEHRLDATASNVSNPSVGAALKKERGGDRGSHGSRLNDDHGPVDRVAYHEEFPTFDEAGWNGYGAGCCNAAPPIRRGTPSCSCDSCCRPTRPSRLWAEADYLLWWTKAARVPALATTSPLSTDAEDAGVLGEPGTSILFGETKLLDSAQSGGRFQVGMWLDDCHREGVAVTYLFLGRERDSFSASQADLAILARPFFNVETEAEDARLIVYPGLVEGRLHIDVESRLQTFTFDYRRAAARSPHGRIDFLLGYRFAELEDAVLIRESTLGLSGPIAGLEFDLFDAFDTRNRFHGARVGVAMEQQIDCLWSYSLQGGIGLGGTRSRTRISGQTAVTGNNVTTTTEGGLLALGTNIGQQGETNFSTVSEFGVTARRQLSKQTALTFGYSVIYWSKVLRAGEQIDREVNPTQIPPGMLDGEARPAFPAAASAYWAQGLRFGFEAAF